MAYKQPTIQQLEATNKAYTLRRDSLTDDDFSKSLNLSKVTTYKRLSKSDWSNQEILFIEFLSNPVLKKLVNSLNILNK